MVLKLPEFPPEAIVVQLPLPEVEVLEDDELELLDELLELELLDDLELLLDELLELEDELDELLLEEDPDPGPQFRE